MNARLSSTCALQANTNVADLVTTVVCSAVLIGCKEIINERFKKRLKVPIPAELLVVIFGTLVSYLADMNQRFDIKIVHDIPLGLPAPRLPSLHNGSTYVMDAIAVAIVSYAISMSLSKSMSAKHHYAIDQNQEMLAHGMMHTVGACFSSFGGAGAPPRTLVHDSSGGKTQVASLVSGGVILLVCLVLGPLFEALPYSVLGSICTVAILPLFKQLTQLPGYWRLNKPDFFVFVVTLGCVVILDVDFGLYIGVSVSLLTVIVATHRARGRRMVQLENTDLLLPSKHSKVTEKPSQPQDVAIFKFFAPLYFANVDNFKRQLFKATFNPNDVNNASETDQVSLTVTSSESNGSDGSQTDEKTLTKLDQDALKSTRPARDDDSSQRASYVILDCSAVTYIDVMGVNALKQVSGSFKAAGAQLLFAGCCCDVYDKMTLGDDVDAASFFPSVHDAVGYTHLNALSS